MNYSVYLYNDADCDLLLGHDHWVRCLAVVSNGMEILSGSYDNTMRRWSVHTGQCLQVYRGHSYIVYCVAELRNGNVMSGSYESIKVWNRVTGECLQTLEGHTCAVFGITVCPNGDVVSASGDGSLMVWRAENAPSAPYVCRQTISSAHNSYVVYCIINVPHSDDLISGGGDNSVKVWHRENPTADYSCVETYQGHTRAVWSVAVMGNGNIVSSSYDKTVKVWSRETRACLYTLAGHTARVCGVAVLADGELVSVSYDKTIKIWM